MQETNPQAMRAQNTDECISFHSNDSKELMAKSELFRLLINCKVRRFEHTNEGQNGTGDLEPQAGCHKAPDRGDCKDCASYNGCEDQLC